MVSAGVKGISLISGVQGPGSAIRTEKQRDRILRTGFFWNGISRNGKSRMKGNLRRERSWSPVVEAAPMRTQRGCRLRAEGRRADMEKRVRPTSVKPGVGLRQKPATRTSRRRADRLRGGLAGSRRTGREERIAEGGSQRTDRGRIDWRARASVLPPPHGTTASAGQAGEAPAGPAVHPWH